MKLILVASAATALFYEQTPEFRKNKPFPVEPYCPPDDNKTKFVIISSARSASSTLQITISSHPDVSALSEAFHPRNVPPPTVRQGWSVERREQNRSDFMHYIFHRTNKRAEGFKFFSFHLKADEYRCLVESPHVRKIVLEREDRYGQYVSSRKASITKCYGKDCDRTVADEELAKKENEFPFEHYKEWLEAWYGLQRDNSRFYPESWLFVTTESIFADPDVMTKVYAHLHVDIDGPKLNYNPYQKNRDDMEDLLHR